MPVGVLELRLRTLAWLKSAKIVRAASALLLTLRHENASGIDKALVAPEGLSRLPDIDVSGTARDEQDRRRIGGGVDEMASLDKNRHSIRNRRAGACARHVGRLQVRRR